VLHTVGQAEQARTYYAEALAISVEHGNRYEQARAHAGVGHALHALGDLDQGRRSWRQALDLYVRLDAPEADALRILLGL
jgi:tetratricopeptide (TPR) repeat protein